MGNNLRGKHLNSEINLSRRGRTPSTEIYGEPTKTRSITVTRTAWLALKPLVKDAGYSSISEFLELIGRGEVSVPKKSMASPKPLGS
jgi:hypothetical protein